MMRFPAFIADEGPYAGAFFFPSHVMIPSLGKQGAVNFLMDTGASEVVIGENDLALMGVHIRSLPTSHEVIAGWGGTTEARQLEDVSMILVHSGGQSHAFDVGRVICGANPKDVTRKKGIVRKRTVSIPSVIWRGFLKKHGFVAHIDLRNEDIYICLE